ncbi:MAG: hypothetical protein CVV49_05580 [Spirochaetae bacterium HGW-Spirochaetae-5]|nr:MAG: hypothetical protein CVV49_05580 [Spirochaetae bacterium HGW-Spirochaetae-5]
MKCRDAHEMLNSYFDNKIDPMKDRLLAEHIKSCPECRAELDFLIKYRNNLKTVKPVPAPDNFLSELHKRIDSETGSGVFVNVFSTVRTGIRSFSFPLEAAGVLALAMVVFFLYRPFFNETIREKGSEFTIESPSEESSALKNSGPAEKEVNRDRFESDNKIAKLKIDPPSGKIIRRNENPLSNIADDKVSSETEVPGSSQILIEMNKARIVKSEKKSTDEEKSLSGESGYSGSVAEESVSVQKDSSPVALPYPDSVLKKYNVSVIKKDLSGINKSYYRVKVDSKRYTSFISDLKKNSIVDVKIISKTETFYEVELFIKNNEN